MTDDASASTQCGDECEEEGDDCELLEDDDIWEKLACDADAGGDAVAAALPDDIDLPDAQWEQEVEGERADAIARRATDADANVWAAIEESTAASYTDAQPPRLGAPRRVSIPSHRLKYATARQVFASSQFNQADPAKSDAFYKRWQLEHKAHREKVNWALAQRKDRDNLLAKKKADRLARQQERRLEKEADLVARRDSRGFDQLLRQGANKEKAEARVARGQGVTYIVPSEEMPDKKAGILPKIRIGQIVPTIKVSAKVMQKASALLSTKAKPSKARAEDPCPYFRVFNKRERK